MIYYGMWFLIFYLIPIIIFFRLTSISPEMMSLKGLSLNPRLKEDNIISVSNNFNAYMDKNSNLNERNIVIKMLRIMCNDADKGICHKPELYLSIFSAKLRKFTLWLLLGSHIPLFYCFFVEIMPFTEIIKYQICCYFLIYILEMVLQFKRAQFNRIFYSNWYDKILNFDLLSVSMIRNDIERIQKLSNSHDLLEAVSKFTAANYNLSTELSFQVKMLSARLEEFLNIQQKTNGINSQNIISSLDDCVKKFSEVYEIMQGISKNIHNSLNSLTAVSLSNKDEINAINKNTDILYDLREQFKTYQSKAFSTELTYLQKLSESLENNINKTFLSIDASVSQNFSRLEVGYDKFFDMCKSLCELMSDKYEEKTISVLSLLFNNFISEFISIKEKVDKLTNAITGTADSTKILCDTVYDFTKYTESPNFMERISNYINFSNKLKDAAEKLISYQKLAELGDVVINKQKYSIKGKQSDSVDENSGAEEINNEQRN